MTTRRLFVSIEVPAEVRAAIAAIQTELRTVVPKASLRLTKPEQFHLTLRFLGDVAEDRIAALGESLAAACAEPAPIPLQAERIGVFPDLRYPRVVWAWVHDDGDRLLALQQDIERAVAPFSEERAEKSFTGHVTLARLHAIKRPQAESLAVFAQAQIGRRFGTWTADAVHLMQSELAPTRHSLVRAARLAGS